jgi:hypothetical protein
MNGTLSDLTEGRDERSIGEYTGGSERPSPAAVAQLAYQFYLMRGRQNGHDLEDWFTAERVLTQHYRWLKVT